MSGCFSLLDGTALDLRKVGEKNNDRVPFGCSSYPAEVVVVEASCRPDSYLNFPCTTRRSPSDLLSLPRSFSIPTYTGTGARVNLTFLTHAPQPRTYRASLSAILEPERSRPCSARTCQSRVTHPSLLVPVPTNQPTNQSIKTNKHAMATVSVVRCLRPRLLPPLSSCGLGRGVRSLQLHQLPQLQIQTRRTLSVPVSRTRLGGLVGSWPSGHDRLYRALGKGGLGRFVGAVGGCMVGCADLGL